MTKLETIQECADLLRISKMSTNKYDSFPYWEIAIEEAIVLITERTPWTSREEYSRNMYARKRKMESLQRLACKATLEAIEKAERAAGLFADMPDESMSRTKELCDLTMLHFEELHRTLGDVQVHLDKVNKAYYILKRLTEQVVHPTGLYTEHKKARELIESLGITLEINVKRPIELRGEALKFYQIVFPEVAETWRGQLNTKEFGI